MFVLLCLGYSGLLLGRRPQTVGTVVGPVGGLGALEVNHFVQRLSQNTQSLSKKLLTSVADNR